VTRILQLRHQADRGQIRQKTLDLGGCVFAGFLLGGEQALKCFRGHACGLRYGNARRSCFARKVLLDERSDATLEFRRRKGTFDQLPHEHVVRREADDLGPAEFHADAARSRALRYAEGAHNARGFFGRVERNDRDLLLYPGRARHLVDSGDRLNAVQTDVVESGLELRHLFGVQRFGRRNAQILGDGRPGQRLDGARRAERLRNEGRIDA
jgi:hypothetical protein